MSFKSTDNATIHGMAGYFEAMLYKDIAISINPKTFSEGMFSWFPLYFPLRVRRVVRAYTLLYTFFLTCSANLLHVSFFITFS